MPHELKSVLGTIQATACANHGRYATPGTKPWRGLKPAQSHGREAALTLRY